MTAGFKVEEFKRVNSCDRVWFTWEFGLKWKVFFNTECTEIAEKKSEEGRDESRPYKSGVLVDD